MKFCLEVRAIVYHQLSYVICSVIFTRLVRLNFKLYFIAV